MALDLYETIRTNKKVVIWSAFLVLLFLVRKLFGLVFLTFILCYIFNNITARLERRLPISRRLNLVIIYIVFVCLVAGVLFIVMPRIASETTIFVNQFPASLDTLHERLDELARKQPDMAPLFLGVKDTLTIKGMLGVNRETLVATIGKTLNKVTHYVSYFFLGTLFSFFILFDLPNLSTRTQSLEHTRFRAIYEETAESVVQFAMVVGAAFQAQILIAAFNTALTALGLWLLGIEPVALLSIIVFFAGLIPVLGTFISSVPILLLAFNSQGWILALKAVGMIAVVHVVEAYILNPNIFSAVLKINPILTLIILYLGYSLFGIWGVLLGVPFSVYIYRYILFPAVDRIVERDSE
ncbi:MAG: AI-2E family transporter [Deltaproteobacteria bacterium]|nr:AI-2E family transporter [Deltaproteobacteria bacterium]